MRMMRSIVLVVAAALCAAAAPATRPSGGDDAVASELQEWVILVTDPNSSQASSASMYASGLPDFANPRRASAVAEKQLEPSPVGVIRLFAQNPDSNDKLDVLLNIKGGRFMGNWPKATSRTTGLLWQDYQLKNAAANLEKVNPKHWLNDLRKGESAYLVKGSFAERFIVYDLEIGYANPVQIRANGTLKYLAWNTGSVPLHDLCIYKPKEDGWHTTTLPKLEPSNPPAATQPSTQAAAPATQPAVAKAGPTTRNVAEPALEGAGMKEALQVLAPWKEKLTAAGLSSTDFDVILAILSKHGLDSRRMTIIYRLDPSEMERLLPIEVVPQPRKMTRVGLVILRNIDPAIGEEIERLVAELGDTDWSKREAAHKALAELGIPAKPKLEEAAKNNKDLEVVWRAERLLSKINREAAK